MDTLIYSAAGIIILITGVLFLTFFEDLREIWNRQFAGAKKSFGSMFDNVRSQYKPVTVFSSPDPGLNPGNISNGRLSHMLFKKLKGVSVPSTWIKMKPQHRP